MKILVVAPLSPQLQPTNAVPLVTNALLAALAPRHTLTLLTATEYAQDEDMALETWRARGVVVRCVPRTPSRGAARWRKRRRLVVDWLRGSPWRIVWYREPRLQHCLNELLARESFDLIAVQDNAAGIYDIGTRTPKVLTEMEVRISRAGETNNMGSLFKRFYQQQDELRWQTYQRATWRKFERIQVLTQRDANAIRQLAPEIAGRTRVNPFSVELPREIFPEREQVGHIVFVGGFTHAPNVDAAQWLAHEIFPRIAARYANTKLTLVGSHPPAAVSALARDNITVAGNVPAIEPYLQAASVIVAPLRRGGGQRIKVLQGMAHGKPVVATPLAAEGLDLCELPPLCIAEDADQFADMVTNLLRSSQTRRALGARAREFVAKHFSPEAYAGRLESEYSELVRSRE